MLVCLTKNMSNSSLKLGISHENETDLIVVQELLKRLSSKEYAIQKSFSCGTGIIGSVTIQTRAFFELHKVDLAIFITDQDLDDAKNIRLNGIIEGISKVNPLYVETSVIVLCNPHIEKWLISDHNAVKEVFNLPRNEPLPNKELPPKDLLNHIRRNQIQLLAKHDAYAELARKMNIQTVRKNCPDFDLFCKNLKHKSNSVFNR
jgi:hypothetical protein